MSKRQTDRQTEYTLILAKNGPIYDVHEGTLHMSVWERQTGRDTDRPDEHRQTDKTVDRK